MKRDQHAAYAPSISGIVSQRGISEVLHFTTNLGLLGIVGVGRVLSRKELPQERYIEHIYSPNCKFRKDQAQYLGYVNMSISRINDWMFETSERWHAEDGVWWVVMSFLPSLLEDDGILFTTTNNIYPSAIRRMGAEGLSRLFAEEVSSRYGHIIKRTGDYLASWPTDRQAEVLYPSPLALDRLQALYVRSGDHVDDIRGMMAGIPDAAGLNQVRIECRPEVFEE